MSRGWTSKASWVTKLSDKVEQSGFEVGIVAGETTELAIFVSDRQLWNGLTARLILRRWVSRFRLRRLYNRLTALRLLRLWILNYRRTITVECFTEDETTGGKLSAFAPTKNRTAAARWLQHGIALRPDSNASTVEDPDASTAVEESDSSTRAVELTAPLRVKPGHALFIVRRPSTLIVSLRRPGYEQLSPREAIVLHPERRKIDVVHRKCPARC